LYTANVIMWYGGGFFLDILILQYLIFVMPMLISVAYATLLERKILAGIQLRGVQM